MSLTQMSKSIKSSFIPLLLHNGCFDRRFCSERNCSPTVPKLCDGINYSFSSIILISRCHKNIVSRCHKNVIATCKSNINWALPDVFEIKVIYQYFSLSLS